MVLPSGLNWTGNNINDIIQLMKKSLFIGAVLIGCFCMTGCGIGPQVPDLSEEQTELITEYAAGLMLKYDANYSGKLLDEEALAKEEATEADKRAKEQAYKQAAEEYLAKKENAKKKVEQSEESNTSDETSGLGSGIGASSPQIDSIGTFYGLDSFNIDYTGYELCDSYPSSGDDVFMAMEATEGKQLLILKFDVTNTSSESIDFDMFYRSPDFNVSVDGGKNIHNQATLLLDDLAAYNGLVEAGAKEPMVLVFEIDGNINQIGSMVLSARNDSGKGQINLQ